MTTLAPSAAIILAMTGPRPVLAPVMIATLSVNRSICVLLETSSPVQSGPLVEAACPPKAGASRFGISSTPAGNLPDLAPELLVLRPGEFGSLDADRYGDLGDRSTIKFEAMRRPARIRPFQFHATA